MIPRVVRKLAIAIAFALCAAVLIGTVEGGFNCSEHTRRTLGNTKYSSTTQDASERKAPKEYGLPRYGATQPKPSARLKDKNASSMKHCLRTRGS